MHCITTILGHLPTKLIIPDYPNNGPMFKQWHGMAQSGRESLIFITTNHCPEDVIFWASDLHFPHTVCVLFWHSTPVPSVSIILFH